MAELECMPIDRRRRVFREIAEERARQDNRWGEQNHHDMECYSDHAEYGRQANDWKALNDSRVECGKPMWDGIFLEEVYEALAEHESAKMRAELVQVAAVAVAWIEAIDRREAANA